MCDKTGLLPELLAICGAYAGEYVYRVADEAIKRMDTAAWLKFESDPEYCAMMELLQILGGLAGFARSWVTVARLSETVDRFIASGGGRALALAGTKREFRVVPLIENLETYGLAEKSLVPMF